MKPAIRLRLLTAEDLAFAEVVRAAAGWNQSLEDWRRFLELEPDGCFLAEWEGAPAGTATTLIHGPELAWIGMVLVHPDYRRRGIGQALLRHCIEHLRARGVGCLKLDATPLGQPGYERLGFRSEWTLARWERAGAPAVADAPPEPPPEPRGLGMRQSSAAFGPAPSETKRQRTAALQDAVACGCAPRRYMATEQFRQEWEALDATVFGVARTRLLNALERQGSTVRCVQAADGTVAAFGLSRPGSRARYLGPVVAASPAAGLALIETLLAEHPEAPVFWDIPEPNEAAVAWAESRGFQRQRPLTRMYLGMNSNPGEPRRQFALAGPEVG
jgi:ribosomal protein S18 acetylase RimI-like enzyme